MAKEIVKDNAQKGDIWYKIIAIFIAACLLLGILVAIVKPTGLADYASMHTSHPYKSEHYEVNNAQLMYMTFVSYNNYYNNYYSMLGEALQYYTGMTPGYPLSQQYYMNDKSTTWLDVCLAEACSTIHEILVLCEAALAEGMTLTEEQEAEIEDNIKAIQEYADQYNYSFKKAVYNLYGSKGITKKDIRDFTALQLLASAYAEKLTDSYEYTDEEYDKHYEDNKKDYMYADYYSYIISADYEKDATDEEKSAAIDAAQKKADELADRVKNGENFLDVMYEYQLELEAKAKEEAEKDAATDTSAETTGSTSNSNTSEDKEEKTEEEKREEFDDARLTERASYTDNELGKWLFADTPAAEAEIKVIDGTENATVYMVVKSAYRDEYNSVNISNMYLDLDDFDNEEELKAYAEEIIKAYQSGEKTFEAFEALAKTFTKTETNEEGKEFTIDVVCGGLIEDATKAYDDSYEKDNEWLFSADRVSGDIQYFEHEDDGIYIYFYDSMGDEVWKNSVDHDLRSADYDKDLEALGETYPVTENAKAIEKIK